MCHLLPDTYFATTILSMYPSGQYQRRQIRYPSGNGIVIGKNRSIRRVRFASEPPADRWEIADGALILESSCGECDDALYRGAIVGTK